MGGLAAGCRAWFLPAGRLWRCAAFFGSGLIFRPVRARLRFHRAGSSRTGSSSQKQSARADSCSGGLDHQYGTTGRDMWRMKPGIHRNGHVVENYCSGRTQESRIHSAGDQAVAVSR